MKIVINKIQGVANNEGQQCKLRGRVPKKCFVGESKYTTVVSIVTELYILIIYRF